MCEHCEKAIKFQGTSEEDKLYIIRNHLNYSPAKGSGFCVLIGYCPECGRELRHGEPVDKMTIDINGKLEDISAMLIGAERYALGRRTYIVQWTCEFIGNNMHLLTEKDKGVMIRDIEEAYSYGDECDKACWKALMKKLKREL